MKKDIDELIRISHYVAAHKGYIQGGGGNTSVKINNTEMAVKASGCKLSDMGEKEGYVVVDYKLIKDYFSKADEADCNFEKHSGEILQASILLQEGLKPLRPSVEAGFHSALKKFVIHSHSVYANLLCCSEKGKALAAEIFKDSDYLWLPYIDPGAKLTVMITQAIKEKGFIPEIIFMENHGVIVSSNEADGAISLHEKVNHAIKEYLELSEDFPEIKLVTTKEGQIKSDSSYVKDFFEEWPKDLGLFKDVVLYPDQLVYLNNSVFKKDGSASDIEFIGGELFYKTSLKQAEVNEETLVAYLFVIQTIKEKALKLVSMTLEQQAFILGWESEAYRKSMLK